MNKKKLGVNPLDTDQLLEKSFFKDSDQPDDKKEKPTHYKIVSISMYTSDIKHLNDMVKSLKQKGYTKISKSQIIRYALKNVDLSKLPKEF